MRNSKKISRLMTRLSHACLASVLPMLLVAGLDGGNIEKLYASEIRAIDGYGNNLENPEWGSAGIQLLRHIPSDYQDGISQPSGETRPSARDISNMVVAQTKPQANSIGATDFVWQWGQFIDHDLDLTGGADPEEPYDIKVPLGDPFFDPGFSGTQIIPLNRSIYDHLTGINESHPRQQVNQITAFLDGSMVYGSDPLRATALRAKARTGRLKMSPRRLLPFNRKGFPNAGGTDPRLFFAGDVRANEQVGLTALHTLFVREHNRLARLIRHRSRNFSGNQIYEKAKAIVIAEIQVITYKEFLPVLLGPNAIPPYTGYDPGVNPSISNIFSTAAYRFGHSMLSSQLLRLKRNGKPIRAGHLSLRDAFFAPHRVIREGGIAPVLRGLAAQLAQDVDPYVIDDVRNFLFGQPGEGGFDLASLNIQRGRDHGLPSYNQARIEFGLSPASSFDQITSNVDIQNRLATVYANVEEVDLWIGGLAEDHRAGALVGELFFRILRDQFVRLRDGDRFWYQNLFTGKRLAKLENTTLSKIIRLNSRIRRNEIQDNVFIMH